MVFGFRKRGAASDNVNIPEVADDRNDMSSGDKTGASSTAIDAGLAAEAVKNLKAFKQFHALDANIPIEELAAVDDALEVGNLEKEVAIERALLEDNSPYPEVNSPRILATLHPFFIANTLVGTRIR